LKTRSTPPLDGNRIESHTANLVPQVREKKSSDNKKELKIEDGT